MHLSSRGSGRFILLVLVFILFALALISSPWRKPFEAIRAYLRSDFTPVYAQAADIATGLVGYWKFDEGVGTTASDSSGNNNTGTLTNGPTWIKGKINNALSFNGTDQSVIVNNNANLSGMSGLTVSAWVKVSSANEGSTVLLTKRHSSSPFNSYIIHIDMENKRYQPVVCNSSGTCNEWISSANDSIAFDIWQHVVLRYDGSEVSMYIDGVPSGNSASLSGNVFASDSNLLIANLSPNPIFALDDLRIYNRALSIVDITGLYNLGSGTPTPSP
jgi:hypothetical protein